MSGYLKNVLHVKQMVSGGNVGYRAKGDESTSDMCLTHSHRNSVIDVAEHNVHDALKLPRN
jgi:hypothetical protein